MKKEDTVKLISAEGFEFIIDRKAALVSNTLRNMLTSSGSFTETQLGEVRFPDISTPVLEKELGKQKRIEHFIIVYIWDAHVEDTRAMAESRTLKIFGGKETEFHIEPEITLELMMAANYLHT